ncbi:glycosyltransferase family 2 protein [Anabaena sp. AL93]|uniref:glycosyltransferase family 2 protein n=1 Tax=Anabaena sp. AL93 TaxID=1678133 RepID=UPI0007FF773F|nr:glycosyltransferase family 2 protein [Anabaena sp. AL93]OBQ16117.1 MAG: glycosyltransferase [Anabaena sp. AL93]
MNKLLTIAIPTYNRAELLDKQLTWLSQAIQGFESECEILVSDNCSTDHTQSIISKWQNILTNITFKSNKNPENIGVMRNIFHCLSSATTKYVWTIGDDDPIQERAVAYVMDKIKNVGAVIFLTATVYRADLIKRALQIWPTASNNWISLAYLAGYCAANGRVIVTKDIYLECIVGVSYWQKEPKSALLMQYQHIPEVILKLEQVGYSKAYCCRMLLQNYHEVDLKVFLGAMRRWPVSAIKTVIPFLGLASVAALELIPMREFKVAESEMDRTTTSEVRNYKG